MEENHTCIICGRRYHACDACRNVTLFTPWRTVACTADCYSLYLLIRLCQKGDADDAVLAQLEKFANALTLKPSVAREVQLLLKTSDFGSVN